MLIYSILTVLSCFVGTTASGVIWFNTKHWLWLSMFAASFSLWLITVTIKYPFLAIHLNVTIGILVSAAMFTMFVMSDFAKIALKSGFKR